MTDTNSFYQYVLPLRAVTHNLYYRIYKGKYHISNVGKKYRTSVKNAFKKYKNIFCFKKTQKLKVDILYYLKKNYRIDLDNLNKGLVDACKDILYEDDSAIFELNCKKFLDQENDQIIINIKEL